MAQRLTDLDILKRARLKGPAMSGAGWCSQMYAIGYFEGYFDALHELLVRKGSVRLGEPTADQLETLDEFVNPTGLERLFERLPTAKNWDELLANRWR